MLDKEFTYYKNHQDELVSKYKGKFILIKDEVVFGPFDTELHAYSNAIKELKFDKGSFLIQQCLPGEASYTQTFHSRVKFAPA
jgi:hypothetical protein